jgi:ankyrin repeat protein
MSSFPNTSFCQSMSRLLGLFVKTNLIIFFLPAGVDVSIPNKLNEFPIELAIKLNKIFVLDALLKSKTSLILLLNSLSNGYNPLLNACENDLTEIAIKLINSGADINLEDENYLNWTPIMYAISNSNEQLIVYLIDKGCDVNFVDDELNTPLHLATDSENEFIVKKLLNAGAKKNAFNNENLMALDIAKANEDESMISLLK